MPPPDPRTDLASACDTIETCYEFLLGYAAQGLTGDAEHPVGQEARTFLERANAALATLADTLLALVGAERLEPRARYRAFIDVLAADARAAGVAIDLVLAQRSIGSQIVDNLNASIHVRALLTDLFLIDEVLKATRPPA
jgi:hypothetical protein